MVAHAALPQQAPDTRRLPVKLPNGDDTGEVRHRVRAALTQLLQRSGPAGMTAEELVAAIPQDAPPWEQLEWAQLVAKLLEYSLVRTYAQSPLQLLPPERRQHRGRPLPDGHLLEVHAALGTQPVPVMDEWIAKLEGDISSGGHQQLLLACQAGRVALCANGDGNLAVGFGALWPCLEGLIRRTRELVVPLIQHMLPDSLGHRRTVTTALVQCVRDYGIEALLAICDVATDAAAFSCALDPELEEYDSNPDRPTLDASPSDADCAASHEVLLGCWRGCLHLGRELMRWAGDGQGRAFAGFMEQDYVMFGFKTFCCIIRSSDQASSAVGGMLLGWHVRLAWLFHACCA